MPSVLLFNRVQVIDFLHLPQEKRKKKERHSSPRVFFLQHLQNDASGIRSLYSFGDAKKKGRKQTQVEDIIQLKYLKHVQECLYLLHRGNFPTDLRSVCEWRHYRLEFLSRFIFLKKFLISSVSRKTASNTSDLSDQRTKQFVCKSTEPKLTNKF